MFGQFIPATVRSGLAALAVWGQVSQAQTPGGGPTLHVTTDSVHREIVVDVSPINLPAHASHHDVQQPPPEALVLPVTGWIVGYASEIVDSAGQRIPQAVLHHLNLIVPQRRELFSQIMQRMGAAGAETPPVELPGIFGHPIVGYPLARGDTVLVVAMLNNPTDHSYPAAHLRVRLPFVTDNAWPHPMSIYPFYLDVMPPAGPHGYDLPPGHSEKSWEGRPAVAGRILAMGGHLHDYGIALRLEDVTAHRVLWQTAPDTNAAGQIVGMPTKAYWWRLGLPLRPDHQYRLTAVYNNPTGKTIPDGAMGALGGVFLPDAMAQWPAVDRSSAEYQRDVQVTYATMGDMQDMHEMHDMPQAPAAPAATPTTSNAGSAPAHHAVSRGMLAGRTPTRLHETP